MHLSVFKTSLRNLRRNKLLSFLNIAGLTTGLAVAILIFNYSHQEFRSANQQSKDGDVYILLNNKSAHVQYEMASLLRDQITGIRYVSMVESNARNEFILKYKNNKPLRSDIIFADSNFTRIFTFQPVSGNIDDALAAPRSIILTESESKRLFNDEDPIGKILSLRGIYVYFGSSDVEVKAVIKDLPENSNLQFKAVVSHSTTQAMMPWIKECIWSCSNVQNYVMLQNGTDPNVLASLMDSELRHLIPQEVDCNFSFLPYREVYFSALRDDFKHGNLKLIYTLGAISMLILLIAIINYINLSVAVLVKRHTEVGVKKIVGVRPVQLLTQFLGESVIISCIAMTLGVFAAYSLTPAINNLSAIHFPEIPLGSFGFWLVLIFTSIGIGIAAGLLPAISFNKVRPMSLITGRSKSSSSGINLKRGLIVLQFIISIILIICTITVTRQLSYLRNTSKGFNSENTINIKLSPEVRTAVFKDKLQHIKGITSVSFSRWFPGNIPENWSMPLISNGVEKVVEFATENADAFYIDIMGLKITQGRNFSDSLKSDVGSAILNEAAVKAFGLKNPLDACFKHEEKIKKIIGVVKDFNFESFHNRIRPLVIFCADENLFSVNVKLAAGSFNEVSSVLSSIEDSWNEVSPNYPFEFKFIDETVANLYKSEIILEKIFRGGSFFAIFISCLGLFGLVLSSTEERKKEIGIRKVYGAKINEVLIMLNKDIIKWIVAAFLIACPVAWYLMDKWLRTFAYKAALSWWIFAVAGLLALTIGLLTVCWQSWKVATKNPVDALRYE
jgi:putative ABC transport system permease protein